MPIDEDQSDNKHRTRALQNVSTTHHEQKGNRKVIHLFVSAIRPDFSVHELTSRTGVILPQVQKAGLKSKNRGGGHQTNHQTLKILHGSNPPKVPSSATADSMENENKTPQDNDMFSDYVTRF